MRALGWFLTVLLGSLVLASLLAYPAFLALHPIQPLWRFDKIATRLFQLFALLGVVRLVRRHGLLHARDWGYGVSRRLWRRDFIFGVIAGIVTMLPVTVTMLLSGARTIAPDLTVSIAWHAVLAGIGSGLAVGFLEETFFRGLMQRAVVRDLDKPALGIALVSVLYAALHFLARVRIPPEAVTWHSGLDLLAGVTAQFLAPAEIVDSFLSLTAVGVLLGWVSLRRGNIAAAVGLHAGWVCVMRTTIGITHLDDTGPWAWLVSHSDGYTGWLALAWTMVLLALVPFIARRSAPADG
jgi:hypothetical protein